VEGGATTGLGVVIAVLLVLIGRNIDVGTFGGA
jgi:hypothetical protein